MGTSYDLTEWDRLDYVQEAHEEVGYAIERIKEGRPEIALSVLEALRERIALRVSDLMDDD